MKLFWMLSAIICLYFSGAFVAYYAKEAFGTGNMKSKALYVVGMFLGLAGVVCCHMLMQ